MAGPDPRPWPRWLRIACWALAVVAFCLVVAITSVLASDRLVPLDRVIPPSWVLTGADDDLQACASRFVTRTARDNCFVRRSGRVIDRDGIDALTAIDELADVEPLLGPACHTIMH